MPVVIVVVWRFFKKDIINYNRQQEKNEARVASVRGDMGISHIHKNRLGTGLAGVASLAILAFPVMGAAAATDSANADLTANLGSTISISATNPAAINITPTGAGAQSSQNGTVTVSTNSAGGYVLTIAASTTTLDTTGGATIPASTGTPGTPIALTNNTWGYRIDNSNGFGTGDSSTPLDNVASSSLTYAGVTTSPVQIKNTSVPVANDVTDVSYSIKANSSQQSGTYTGQVTYTATTQ